jgi:alkylated DNA repair protein (DNA oxidative demethylase)
MAHTAPLPLLDPAPDAQPALLSEGARHLPGFARTREAALLADVAAVSSLSPFRHMTTRGGYSMSVALTNCGEVGWVSDRCGYRYAEIDPLTLKPWPTMPVSFVELAAQAAATAGYAAFRPNACLVNRYQPGAHLSLHQDRDELDLRQPIVSVSLGIAAEFLWGGPKRADRPHAVSVFSGDVIVFGGVSRLNFHGVKRLASALHPLSGALRYNLTFRKAL